METPILIRRGSAADHVALGEVMYDAVRNGPSRYTSEQRAAWVPEPRKGPDWDERLGQQIIIIAEQAGTIVGFMTLEAPAYVDFAYIRPSWQRKGVFRALHDAIEQEARRTGQTRLHVHASLMAQPAFAALGYSVTAPEDVSIRGIAFKRFAMEKALFG
ncbi:GNAT family N-acetyltransferase [Maricaulis sp.]|uniref:GNAT family N-acetyltransferase n=1 Tax=Maricaulis sp. TaxID=1486257 RepID=UPI0025C73906|nr:GNAT family N-acetyltransferase [Maricaulis sp.]